MSQMIGIDLGTTNSCVAVVEGDGPVIIPNAEGARTTPSIVAFTKDGKVLVGQTAKRQAIINPERTISSIKRSMGTDRRIRIDGRSYSPQEISAMILAQLKGDAERYLGAPVTDAVITVPAYFSDSQRRATKDAGEIAGLNVQRIINEPTSAALAYGINRDEPQKVLVFDLGGGTFDVSILDIARDVIEVVATSGDNHLGGNDFDACIVDFLVGEFKKQSGADIHNDAAAMQRLTEAAEAAKCELSSATSATINLPFLATVRKEAKHLEYTLDRATFDRLTAHLVSRTTVCMRRALDDARLSARDIGRVLLVGGSSRIPAVQKAVRDLMGKEPSAGINPDECVAIGASLQGGVLGGQVKSLLLLDVTPLSLGVETIGDVYSKIIERNSPLPIEQSEVYSTAAPFQSTVEIHVLQGEDPVASHNRSLARFRLDGIRRAMAGVPRIQVTFSIDVNGIVGVTAKDLDTGREQHITIVVDSNLSRKQIEDAKKNVARLSLGDGR